MPEQHFLTILLKNKVLTNLTLILLRGVQNLIFLEVGHGKIKTNRCVERSPKMRNLHRCHCLQKFSKHEISGLKCSIAALDFIKKFALNFKE